MAALAMDLAVVLEAVAAGQMAMEVERLEILAPDLPVSHQLSALAARVLPLPCQVVPPLMVRCPSSISGTASGDSVPDTSCLPTIMLGLLSSTMDSGM
jgi:hypothetical protein